MVMTLILAPHIPAVSVARSNLRRLAGCNVDAVGCAVTHQLFVHYRKDFIRWEGSMVDVSPEKAYIAKLWEQPTICIGLFGVQFQTEEGQRLYDESGITEELMAALAAAPVGFLHAREMMTQEGPIIMVYWRSYDDLDRWARTQPHSRWWHWLVDNTGKGVVFYHEIYQARTAEAVYEPGTRPVGPALFCGIEEVPAGEGRSRERQRRFAEGAPATST
jgi:hypothetical protein